MTDAQTDRQTQTHTPTKSLLIQDIFSYLPAWDGTNYDVISSVITLYHKIRQPIVTLTEPAKLVQEYTT